MTRTAYPIQHITNPRGVMDFGTEGCLYVGVTLRKIWGKISNMENTYFTFPTSMKPNTGIT